MTAHRRLRKLRDLNELGDRELTLLQEEKEAAPGEVAQSAHSVEDPGFSSYNIHKSGLKDTIFGGRRQG